MLVGPRSEVSRSEVRGQQALRARLVCSAKPAVTLQKRVAGPVRLARGRGPRVLGADFVRTVPLVPQLSQPAAALSRRTARGRRALWPRGA